MAFQADANPFPYHNDGSGQGANLEDPIQVLYTILSGMNGANGASRQQSQQTQTSPPSPEHIQEAQDYVKKWCRKSIEYVQRKIWRWELFEDLYWNRRKLDDWDRGQDLTNPEWYASGTIRGKKHKKKSGWQARTTIAVSPFVDSNVQQLHQAVFANEEYFKVKPRPKAQSDTIEDPQYPTSRKIQTWLLQSCDDLQFKGRTYEALLDAVIFGTCVAKLPWYQEKDSTFVPNPMTGVPEQRVLRQGTPLDLVNLAKFLPDPNANSGDVQRWSGVGDRSEIEYGTIVNRFNTGIYNCGHEEFMQQWPDEGERTSYPETIKDDQEALTAEDGAVTKLQVWDWHGRIYFTDRPAGVECVVTLISGLQTNLQGAEPSAGIIVRLQEKPILSNIGRRPYAVWHFIPCAQPFGQGAVEQNLDLIWTISHLQNLFLDTVRSVSIPTIKVWENSPWLTDFETDPGGDIWYPGKILKFRNNPNEIEPFSLQVSNLNAIFQLIQLLKKELQERTSISDISRGAPGQRKTASEVHTLLVQGQRAPATKLGLLKEAFLDTFGRIALGHFQANVTTDQTLFIKGPTGPPVPMVLTANEIATGEYTVTATLDIQTDAKVSKAQTIMQVMPVLEQLAPALLQENKLYRRAGMVEALLRYLDISETATVLQDIDDQTRMGIQQAQMQEQMMAQQAEQAQRGGGQPGQGQPPQEGGSPEGEMPPEVAAVLARVHGGGAPNGGPAGQEPSSINDFLRQMQQNGTNAAPHNVPQRRAA